MRKTVVSMALIVALTGLVFAADPEYFQEDPVSENVILRLDAGTGLNTDNIQKMFTALGTSYLKNHSSYIVSHEIYNSRNKQSAKSSLVLTEVEYETFTVTNLRYTFSNGYFELKFSDSPFTALVNGEIVNSTDYSEVGKDIYNSINRKLQDAAYVSRGYAARYKKASTVSFYLFK